MHTRTRFVGCSVVVPRAQIGPNVDAMGMDVQRRYHKGCQMKLDAYKDSAGK